MVFGALANTSSSSPLWSHSYDWYLALCLPVLGGLSLAMAAAKCVRLANPQAVAVAIECCYQNTGLALTIALSAMRPEDVGEASGVPIAYGLVELTVIPLFALAAWRLGWTYAPRHENICVVLAGNYQPDSSATDGSGEYRPAVHGRELQ